MIDFTDEQKLAQQMLRQWTTKELAPHVTRMEKGEILPYDLARKLIRSFGIDEMVRAMFTKMEAAAGSDKAAGANERAIGDPSLMAIVSMELSRVCPGFCLSFGASLGLAGGAIMAKGTLAQKQRWALPILVGDKIGAWAMTEPGAGSDAFGSMRTVARREGDIFIISGQKTFITNAPYADTFVVYAKLEGAEAARQRPFHAFLVDKGTPGLTVGKPMDKMGMCSSPTGEVFLSDVRVPVGQLLGETLEEPSRKEARDVFHGERTGMAPMCLGIIERCLEDSLAYARQRETWGQRIADYQLIQEKLARMYMHRENVRNLLFRQFEKMHKKVPITMAEASACKLYCGRAATETALEAIQIMGGNGYMREYHVEMLMRDAKLLQIGGGTDEIQIVTVARHLIKDGLPQ
jgi:acyl-CoA dehydrogenase